MASDGPLIPRSQVELLAEVRRRAARRRRHRLGGLSAAGIVVAAAVAVPVALAGTGRTSPLRVATAPTTAGTTAPAATSSTATSTVPASPNSSVHPLFVAPEVSVVADDPNTGCSRVYWTTDLVHWRNISPPNPEITGLPAGAPAQCSYIWASASFVSANDGWVLGRDEGSTDTVLYHTADGGKSWTKQPGGHTGSNGGSEIIGFANPSFGWRQQFATGANGPYSLELTNNGGTTWTTAPSIATHGGDQNLPVVFANPSVAFAANPLTYVNALSYDAEPAPWVWRTTDGGNHWSHFSVPAPPSVAGATAFYGQPRFFDQLGVLPVAFTNNNGSWVGFYRSTNSGITWQLQTLLRTTSDLLAVPDVGNTAPTHVAGAFPVVAIASPSTYWVVGTSTTGTRTVSVTNDSGTTWASNTAAGIPAYKPTVQKGASQEGFVSLLQAASPTQAWIQVTEGSSMDSQSAVLLKTPDGGRTWKPIQTSP